MTYVPGASGPAPGDEPGDELLRDQARSDAAAASPEDRSAAHYLRALDQLDEDIRAATRRSRAARKVSGWFFFGTSVLCAAVLAATMLGEWLDLPESAMDVAYAVLASGMFLFTVGLILWTVLHDLHLRRVRRTGWRLVEPGTHGGEAMVAIYRLWWDRLEENRNPRWGFGGDAELLDLRDPEWSAEQIMSQSKAVPDVLCTAWEENPRRSWLVGTAILGAVSMGVLFSGMDDGDLARIIPGGTLLGVAFLLWVFTSRNKGPYRRDQRIFARRLEEMRQDHAYTSYVSRR